MVYIGGGAEEEEERVATKSMAMSGGEKTTTKPLHNFNLTFDLKWGNQKHLRCMKLNSSDAGSSGGEGSGVDHRRSSMRLESSAGMTARRRESSSEFEKRRFRGAAPTTATRGRRIESDDAEEGIEAVREKLMFDFKTAADKMKDAILREEEVAVAVAAAGGGGAADTDMAPADEEEDVEMAEAGESSPAVASAAAEVRPWNLRTRRAACKAPIGGGGAKGLRIEEKKAVNYSPLRSEGGAGGGNNGVKSPRLLRGGGASGSGSGSGPEKEKERPKFTVTLTKKEIEEDFMAMLGHRPPRRPKRRPKNVQKQLDALFPGMWLTEVSAETYKVPEFPESGKR